MTDENARDIAAVTRFIQAYENHAADNKSLFDAVSFALKYCEGLTDEER